MKKLLINLMSIGFSGVISLNSHIVTFTKEYIKDFTFDPTTANFSDFKPGSNWNINDIQDEHNINIDFTKLNNSNPKFLRWSIYNNISIAIDNKYNQEEKQVYNNTNIFSFLSEDPTLYTSKIFFTILNKSSNSTQALNDNNNSFTNFSIKNNEIKSYYLRISNFSSMDWTTNKSYFDISVNICNFDTSNKVEIANYNQNMNKSFLSREGNLADYADAGYYDNAKGHHILNNKEFEYGGVDHGGIINYNQISSQFNSFDTTSSYVSSITVDGTYDVREECATRPWETGTVPFSVTIPFDKNNFPSETDYGSDYRFWPSIDQEKGPEPYDFDYNDPVNQTCYHSHSFTSAYTHVQGFMLSAHNSTSISLFGAFQHMLHDHLWEGYNTVYELYASDMFINFNSTIFQNKPNNKIT